MISDKIKKSHGVPGHYGSVGVPVVNTENLLASVQVKPCFPFIHFLGFDSPLSLRRSHHIEQLNALRHFVQWDGLVVAHFLMPVQFDSDSFDELISIVSLHGLIPVRLSIAAKAMGFSIDFSASHIVIQPLVRPLYRPG